MSRRIWTYSRDSWLPERRWSPYFGHDEYGFSTVVLPIPFAGYLVIAYKRCLECKLSDTEGYQHD